MQDLSNENIIHIKKENIEYLQFKKLLEYEDVITHCITLKPQDFGNVSNYEIVKETVEENYKKICKELNLNYNNIVRPKQTHTDNIKTVGVGAFDNPNNIYPEYLDDVDGVITDKKDIVLSTAYADCIPLIFFDPVKKVVANIHSGWQGTLKRIGVKAVKQLIEEYSCNPRELICCIGPSIRKCCFEVDQDVKKQFEDEFNDVGAAWHAARVAYHATPTKQILYRYSKNKQSNSTRNWIIRRKYNRCRNMYIL